ncbi:MAG: sodium:solute symporter family transporter [Anaerostipes hadrus]
MSANQKIILAIFIVYLALNAAIGIIFSNRQNKKQHTSSEKKFFIGGRNMNGLLLAMTTMATYTSVSSFISGPGAAGLTYGYAQAWIATVQVPITFLVLGVLGNKLALVSRRTGAVTVVGYLKARYKSDVGYCNQLTYGCLLHGTNDRTIYWSNFDLFLLDLIMLFLLIFGAVVIIYTSLVVSALLRSQIRFGNYHVCLYILLYSLY